MKITPELFVEEADLQPLQKILSRSFRPHPNGGSMESQWDELLLAFQREARLLAERAFKEDIQYATRQNTKPTTP